MDGTTNPNPLLIMEAPGRGKAVITSRQAVRHLLCQRCENVLSVNEKYALVHALNPGGAFQLRDKLSEIRPSFDGPTFSLHRLCHVPAVDRHALQHFAVGVFWKASVQRWDIPPGGELQNPLGREHERDFSGFLLGGAPFPAKARLMLTICGEPDPFHELVFPVSRKSHGYHTHAFYLPGVGFHLLLGRVLPKEELALLWGADPAEVPIVVHKTREEGSHQEVFAKLSDRTKSLIHKAMIVNSARPT